jgi:ferredoxin
VHKCTVTRKEGKYHLECETCGLITAQPANRGGLIARGERHESSNGQLGGPVGSKPAIVLTPRDKERQQTLSHLAPVYGKTDWGQGHPLEGDEPLAESAPIKVYKRPAFQQAVFDNKCMECGGPLMSPEGGFCTTAFPVKAVCRGCKTGAPA